jgi:hypothetical protein
MISGTAADDPGTDDDEACFRLHGELRSRRGAAPVALISLDTEGCDDG